MDRTTATGRRRSRLEESLLARIVAFLLMAEFEILFLLFFFVAFLLFKELTSRPEYNQILVKHPGNKPLFPFG